MGFREGVGSLPRSRGQLTGTLCSSRSPILMVTIERLLTPPRALAKSTKSVVPAFLTRTDVGVAGHAGKTVIRSVGDR